MSILRTLGTILLAAVLLVAFGFSMALNAAGAPAPVAANVNAPAASFEQPLPTLSPSPVAWQVLATGEAASTQAAAAYTAVAQSTRDEQDRQGTATQARMTTLEAQALTPAAGTAAAIELTAENNKRLATREAKLTEAADQANGVATNAAATATQANVEMVATQAKNREIATTTYTNAAEGLKPLGQICWGLLLPCAAAVLLWYAFERLKADLNRRAIVDTPWGPALIERHLDGTISYRFLAPSPEVHAATARALTGATTNTVRAPMVPAVHPDNTNDLLRTRVLNLLAASIQVEGVGGTKIPRYHHIGYSPNARDFLVNALEAAGCVTVVKDEGPSKSGTFLKHGLTLHQLWAKINADRSAFGDPTTAITITPAPMA